MDRHTSTAGEAEVLRNPQWLKEAERMS